VPSPQPLSFERADQPEFLTPESQVPSEHPRPVEVFPEKRRSDGGLGF
jgi:hypothetical protein